MALRNITTIMNRMAKELGFQQAALTEIAHKTRDPFRVLISCILSLRTRDETTHEASKRLYAHATTPETMVKLRLRTLEKAIYPVGFYRTKARRIREISRLLLDQHGGQVPDTLEDLLSLPGVGRKTANIVLVYGFRKMGLPIDTHCHRIPNRLGWIKTKTPDETEQVLRQRLPQRFWKSFNNLFVGYGQKICKPVGPRCNICPIEKYCQKVGVLKRPKD